MNILPLVLMIGGCFGLTAVVFLLRERIHARSALPVPFDDVRSAGPDY